MVVQFNSLRTLPTCTPPEMMIAELEDIRGTLQQKYGALPCNDDHKCTRYPGSCRRIRISDAL